MNFERVISEVERCGAYLRGDSSIGYDGEQATMRLGLKDNSLIGRLLPSLPAEISGRIRYPTHHDISTLTDIPLRFGDRMIEVCGNGRSMAEGIAPLVDLANRIVYPDVHITRRAGSYILILDRKAVYATESMIDYCPLAKMLFTRHGMAEDISFHEKLLAELNGQAIGQFGMFGDGRKLRECEAKVPFGSSEMMMEAMRQGYFDCTVQVCDGVGTVLTFEPESSQGVGAVMTGTFYTTPIDSLVERCYDEGVYPVFPETGDIDQIGGVKAALRLGRKRIAVTTAADYNRNLAEISGLEKDGATIYRFALCSTGIDEETAQIMADHSDIAWSCASKHVRDIIAPQSLVQIGLKIPVYVMSERGWDLVKTRLIAIDPGLRIELDGLELGTGDRYVFCRKGADRLAITRFSKIEDRFVDGPRPLV